MDVDSANVKQQLATLRFSAMNILAVREHSIAELRTKLERKLARKQKQYNDTENIETSAESAAEISAELVESVLQQLIADDLLNEVRFTESFIRYRIGKGSGPVKIRHELLIRGISSELINNALETSYEFWQEHIGLVFQKRFGENKAQDYKQQSKQSRFLYQRGFSSEMIRCFFN